jgi:sulfate adenylyltransferase subunit 1 (EFTu-like GTPase family)
MSRTGYRRRSNWATGRAKVLWFRRGHSLICSLLGIQKVALAINKINLVEIPEAVYKPIVVD